MPVDPLIRLRALCLALPESSEKLAWGEPTFRVRNKIFAFEDLVVRTVFFIYSFFLQIFCPSGALPFI